MAESGIAYGDLSHETDSGSELYGNFIGFIRPPAKWRGDDFGFDFVPNNMFMGEDELNMGKQYKHWGKRMLELDCNEYEGTFKDEDNKMLNSLLNNEYKCDRKSLKQLGSVSKNYRPWISLYPKKVTINEKKVTYEDVSTEYGERSIPRVSDISVPKTYTQNTKATLEIKIFGNGAPDYFAFEQNNHFKISPSKMEVANSKKKNALADELKKRENNALAVKKLLEWKVTVDIICLTEFDKDQELTLNAYFVQKSGKVETVAVAKLMVWANKARGKTKKVVLVQVITPAMSKDKGQIGVAPSDLSACNAFLNQALVQVEVDDIIELDLSEEPEFLPNGIYRHGNSIESVPRNPEQSKLGVLWDKVFENEPPPQPISLAPFLVDKIGDKYKDHLKLFFFAESSKKATTAAFNSALDPTVTVYYNAQGKNDFDQNIMAHELLHGFGLGHSFSNSEAGEEAEKKYGSQLNSKYTYIFNETNNIMDYGTRNNKYATWQWQWEIVNKK